MGRRRSAGKTEICGADINDKGLQEMAETTVISVRVDSELHRNMKANCALRGITLRMFLEEAIRGELEKHGEANDIWTAARK